MTGSFSCSSSQTIQASPAVSCVSPTLNGTLHASSGSSSSASVGVAAGAGAGGAVAVACVVVFLVLRARRGSGASKAGLQLCGLIQDGAKSAFLREYGHSVADHKGFEFSFGQLQLARKRVQLGREIGRTGAEVVYHSTLQPEKRPVVVRCHESNDMDRQSAVLREAMVLHLFRHDNILALLHVCRCGRILIFGCFEKIVVVFGGQ